MPVETSAPGVRRRLGRIDFAPLHRQPLAPLLVFAAAVSIAGSIAIDVVAVHVGEHLYPATRHFSHFRPADYVTLTVIGVLVACAAWPLVARATSVPRWLFFRLAVAVTVLLWIPDGWLLLDGQDPHGVAVLMSMHLAIALFTYNVLVHVAPVRKPSPAAAAAVNSVTAGGEAKLPERTVLHLWNAMALLVGIELAVGVSTIVVVPFRRTDALIPVHGTTIYLVHGALGLVLAAGAVAVLVASSAAERLPRIGAVMGAVGVAAGLLGGVAASYHSSRLLGMGVMLIGVLLAGVGYLVPTLEAFGKAEAQRAGVPQGLEHAGGGGRGPEGGSAPGVAGYVQTDGR